jgi:MFS family permease
MLPWRPLVCVLLPFAAGYYLSYLFRSINALIAGDLAAELGLTAGDLGLLTAIYFLVFAAVQLPFGVLLDRCGPRLIQSALLLVAGAGALVFALADGVVTLMLGRALIGLGVALALMAGLKAIVLWFPPQRLALANGWFIMLGALGALTATGPAELVVQSLGWRGLFALLAALCAIAALLILLVVPEEKKSPPARPSHGPSVWTIYQNRRFWKIAPISAIGIGTSWSLQGLWAAPWLADVAGLDRPAAVQHLTAMAAALAAAALLLGALANRLRRSGIPTEIILAGTLGLSMAAQFALLLGLPVPSHLLWIIIAAAGAATVLSFAILAQYFPKEASGRANAALGVLHVGAAFALQSLAGLIIGQWPQTDGHYPAEAHQAAMAVGIGLQLVSLGWFLTAPRRRPQTSMADAVTRMLGLDSPPVLVPAGYRTALSAWAQHVEHVRRQARAWRFAAVGSGVLCAGLTASLSLTLPRPAIALHIIDSGNIARADRAPAKTDAGRPIRGPNLLQAVHSAVAAPLRPELRAHGERVVCPLFGDRCALVPVRWWQEEDRQMEVE